MRKVYILCGMIASGKTTYAKSICEEEHAVLLSVDEVMLQLYDGCLGPSKHKEVMEQITTYFLNLSKQLLKQDCSIVLDYGYWTKAERNWIKAACKKANLPLELHYITCEDSIRLQRLALRNTENKKKQGREYIIEDDLQKNLDARFELPTPEEYDAMIHTS